MNIRNINECQVNPVAVLVLSKESKAAMAVIVIRLFIVIVRSLHDKDVAKALHVVLIPGEFPDV